MPEYTTPVPYNTMAAKLGGMHLVAREAMGGLHGLQWKNGSVTERESIKGEMTLDQWLFHIDQLTNYLARSAAGEPVDEFIKSSLDAAEFQMYQMLGAVGINEQTLFPEGRP